MKKLVQGKGIASYIMRMNGNAVRFVLAHRTILEPVERPINECAFLSVSTLAIPANPMTYSWKSMVPLRHNKQAWTGGKRCTRPRQGQFPFRPSFFLRTSGPCVLSNSKETRRNKHIACSTAVTRTTPVSLHVWWWGVTQDLLRSEAGALVEVKKPGVSTEL